MKEILIDAIRRLEGPYYNLFSKYETLNLGRFYGGMVDTWKWNSKDVFNKFSENELKEFYEEIKNSWKN